MLAHLLLLGMNAFAADLPSRCAAFQEEKLAAEFTRLTPAHRGSEPQDSAAARKAALYQIEWTRTVFSKQFGQRICPEVAKLQALSPPEPDLSSNGCKLLVSAFHAVRGAEERMRRSLEEIRRCYDGSKMPGAVLPPGACERGKNKAHLSLALKVGEDFSRRALKIPEGQEKSRLQAEQQALFGPSGPLAPALAPIPSYLNEQEAVWEKLRSQANEILNRIHAQGCERLLPPSLR